MDLVEARERIMEAPDVPALSAVLLELLVLAGQLDQLLTETTKRVGDLEMSLAEAKANLRAGLRP